MFKLLRYLFGMEEDEEEKYSNHWEELIKKNTIHHTELIDWDLIHCDLLIFNCSHHDIKIEYDGKSRRMCSYLGCEGESPACISFKLTHENTIKISCDNKTINKKIYPKTILYLEDKDLCDDYY